LQDLVEIRGNLVIVNLNEFKVVISVYASNIVRVSYLPLDKLSVGEALDKASFVVVKRPQGCPFNLEVKDDAVSISTDEIVVVVNRRDNKVAFYSRGIKIVEEIERELTSRKILGIDTYSFKQKFSIDPSESVYGLGQHAGFSAHTGFNYRGRTVYLMQRNTDIAVPFMVSSKGYGILWDIYSMGAVSVDYDGIVGVWFEACDFADYYLIYGPSIDRVIAGYRWLTGKVPLLPLYVLGYWQSKERYASQDEILAVARAFREKNIPIDVIVQDHKYWGKHGFNAFKFDVDFYPNPKHMVEELHKLNMRILISVWPFFGDNTEVFREAQSIGCIIAGTTLLNVFEEKCREWYWKKIEEAFYSIGIDGWWLDASEPDIVLRWMYGIWQRELEVMPGVRMFKYLNIYPLLETEAVYKGQRKVSNKRVVILTRSGFAGIQRNGVINWSGDVTCDWTTFRTQIWAGLNYSLSGLPYWTTDIGGFFSCNPELESCREIFVRWFEWGAFCPIFRVHGTYYPKEPWRFGKEVEDILVKYIRLRYRLIPYIYTLAWMVHEKDYTIMRPLVMDFKDDEKTHNIDDQYMFGPFIMVSPITTPSTFEREVYLPHGIWYDFWTGERMVGSRRIKVGAPLDIIPLHIKAGALIPMVAKDLSHTKEKFNEIELRVYRGNDGEFQLYIDDGETYDYEKGRYALVPIKWVEGDKRVILGKLRGIMELEPLVFRIVVVDKEKGVGLDVAKPDAEVEYKGDEVVVNL